MGPTTVAPHPSTRTAMIHRNAIPNRGSSRSEENRKPFLRVESLEGRVLMTGVPDLAGDTIVGARTISVPYMHTQQVTDVLPLASDVDYFKIDLKKGDYFIADVDPNG